MNDAASRYRWYILAIFVLSTAINYLDRQTLAALAPAVQKEFGLNDFQYGLLGTVFSIPYALVAPFAGLLIDRIGLTRAISLALALWSFAGIATGLTRGLASLIVCRAVLGAAEAAGIPAAGKAIVTFTKPGERAMGHGMNQAAVSLGMMLAPLLATWIMIRWGWRTAFIATGTFGLIWIPVWRAIAPAPAPMAEKRAADVAPYRDRRLWAVVAANALHAVPYSLWFGWTTKYFVTVFRLDLKTANAYYAWIPPVLAAVGGFLCGWASLQVVKRGAPAVVARYRVCLGAAVVALVTGLVPLAGSPAWAAALISVGIGAVAGFSVNLYAMPLDLFGESRAAFAISFLVATYGVAQALISAGIGWTSDHYGYTPVTTVAAITPLLACAILRTVKADR